MAKTFNIKANFQIKDEATKVLKKTGLALKSIGRQFKLVTAAGSSLTSSITKVLAPLTIMTGIAGSGFIRGIKSAQEYANAIGDLADRLGVSTKFLQEQSYIAKMNASSSEEMTAAIENLSKQYGMLKSGTGSLYTSLQKISPALARQLQGAKSSEEAFNLMIKALRKVEDPARRVYLAQLAFGSAGKGMINIAEQSEESLENLRKEAAAAGLVMDETSVKGAQDLGGELTVLQEHVRGIFNMFASKLIPILTPFIKRVTEWIKANRELIATKIDKFAAQFAEILGKIDLETILNAMSGFASICLRVTDALAGLNKWIILLGVALASGVVCNFLNFLGTLKTMLMLIPGMKSAISALTGAFVKLGIAILTTPIGWISLGIIAVVAAFVFLWNKCEGFRNFWTKTWDIIKKSAQFAFDFITGAINAILHPIDTLMEKCEGFRNFWTKTWDIIKKSAQFAFDFITGAINAILHPIDTLIEKFAAVKKIGSWIADKMGFGDDEREEQSGQKSGDVNYVYNNDYGDDVENNTAKGQLTQSEPMKLQQVYTPYPQNTQQTQSRSEVVVKFDNMPKEASVETVSKEGNTDLGVEYGYAMGGA